MNNDILVHSFTPVSDLHAFLIRPAYSPYKAIVKREMIGAAAIQRYNAITNDNKK